MTLTTVRKFHKHGKTYHLQTNSADDVVRLYLAGSPPKLMMFFDQNLTAVDPSGNVIGTLVIGDGQVQGFIQNNRVADSFNLHEAMEQLCHSYLACRIESSDAFKEIEKYKLVRPKTVTFDDFRADPQEEIERLKAKVEALTNRLDRLEKRDG